MGFGDYDFGLSSEQEARAARLHGASIIVDMLWQGPCGYRSYRQEWEDAARKEFEGHGDRARGWGSACMKPLSALLAGDFPEYRADWEASGITAGCYETSMARESSLASFGTWTAVFDRNPWIVKALRTDDIRRAKRDGLRAAWLNCQTGVLLPLDQYTAAHDHGLRMFQLAYNDMNGIAAGCTERADGGVSRAGAAVIAHMNELGIIVDTSHVGKQSTLDACDLSAKPVIASHTSAEKLYAHPRSKSDEEMRAIAATGGVVGVYAVPFFLSSGDDVTLDTMLDHIDHVVDTIGAGHAGIGCDWPMQVPKWALGDMLPAFSLQIGFREGDVGDPRQNVVGFDDYRDFPNITRGLVARGYTDEQITGILGENFLRVFEAVCG